MVQHSSGFPSRFAALAVLVLFGGCLEYETTTTVRSDGSFKRTVTVKGDSASLRAWKFQIPVDSTWTVLGFSKGDKDEWVLTAERSFSSPEDWSQWANTIDHRVLTCSVSVETSFRFFTTGYRFTETISAYNPFTLVPVTDYISQSELDAFLRFEVFKESYPSRGDSLALDDAGDRFQEWENQTRAESFFQAIVQSVDPAVSLDSARMARIKRSLLEFFVEEKAGKENMDKDIERWSLTVKDPAVRKALKDNPQPIREFRSNLDYINNVGSDSYVSRVEMPGEITNTNGRPEGTSGVVWKDYIAYAYVHDFTMVAESSEVNVWAIVLSLAVIAGLPVFVWGMRKRVERRK